MIAPGAHLDLVHTAAAGRKQRRVPAEQPVGRESLFVFLSGIERHLDDAIELLTSVTENEFAANVLGTYGFAADVLVESLLERSGSADVQAAQAEIDRLAAVHTDAGFVWNEFWLLRLRALLARARGDEAEYRQFADRYRAMAVDLDYQGHIAVAEAMT